MGPFRNVLALAVMLSVAMPVYSTTTYVFFSDYDQCANTYVVGREDVVQIEDKRESSAGSSAFTSCSLLFRAKQPDDKLCIKISKLTFTDNTLQYQYFDSLDPAASVTPTASYDYNNVANTPTEICSNAYEITMKLQTLTSSGNPPSIDHVDLLITVFSMQGDKRIAYMDEDCPVTYKLSDSTIFVRNTNSRGAMEKKDLCQMHFEYIGTNPNKTICLQYMKIKDVCDYSLQIFDGPQDAGFTREQKYTCTQTLPQTWCSKTQYVTFELDNSGAAGLPDDTFSVEVKDAVNDDAFSSGSSMTGSLISLNVFLMGAVSLMFSWLQ